MRHLSLLILLTAATILHAQTPFARNLGETRSLLTLEDGTVLVSRPSTFDVVALRDRDNDGVADEIRTAVSSVEGASGLAFHDGTLFVTGSKGIVSADRLPDGSFGPWRELVTNLPGANAIAVGPDGRIYASVAEQKALWQIERDGLTRRVYARGLGDVAAITFDDKGVARAVATLEGAQFTSDASGTIFRSSSKPPSMTSSSPSEPTRSILSKEFELRDLRGAESVLYDEEQDVYFVSGKGFIARVSPEGKVTERTFIDDVKAPRGMAVRDVELWVVDGTAVRVFNRVTGHAVRAIELAKHGAVDLSHVAVGGDDAVYVTDSDRRSGGGRIFRIESDGDVEVAIHGEELRSPAGIAWDGTRFLVAQSYGNEIVGWQPGHAVTAVLRGPGAYDGLTILPNGIVIASSQNDAALHVGTTGDLRPLFARNPAPAGIAFDRKRNRLLVASSEGNSLEAWTLPPLTSSPPRTAKERPSEYALSTSPPPAPSAAGSRDMSSTTR
jgi:sugar lactone lactonase YvrE